MLSWQHRLPGLIQSIQARIRPCKGLAPRSWPMLFPSISRRQCVVPNRANRDTRQGGQHPNCAALDWMASIKPWEKTVTPAPRRAGPRRPSAAGRNAPPASKGFRRPPHTRAPSGPAESLVCRGSEHSEQMVPERRLSPGGRRSRLGTSS